MYGMLVVAATYLLLGYLTYSKLVVKENKDYTLMRIMGLFFATGGINFFMYLGGYYLPVIHENWMIFSGITICMFTALVLMEINSGYRRHRNYIDKLMDEE